VRGVARPRARKSLGQHWLVDQRYLRRIAEAVDCRAEDTVLEIGAGTGLLTRYLAERAVRLIAVEIDQRLAAQLRETFAAFGSVSVVEADALEEPVERLLSAGGGGMPYVLVGNLPYFIGTAIVRKFLYSKTPPRRIVCMLQEEVAESMASRPGRMTYLGVETQLLAEAQVLFRVPPRAFRPPPKVRSAVIRLDLLSPPEVEVDDRKRFLNFVQAGFAAPRKKLRNSLIVGLRVPAFEIEEMLRRVGIEPQARPADLHLKQWRDLYFAYRGMSEGGG
jgi:16S rRNA (adenine1518-N6/adenine1519-N6)-dimethyltransferase